MSSMTEITVTDLRRRVGPLTDSIRGGESFRVTSYDRPLMALLPWARADELVAAEMRVEAAAALHFPSEEDGECEVCMVPMPCATLVALGGGSW